MINDNRPQYGDVNWNHLIPLKSYLNVVWLISNAKKNDAL